MFTQSLFTRTFGMTLLLSLSLGIACNTPTYAEDNMLEAGSTLKGSIVEERRNEFPLAAETASDPKPSPEEEVLSSSESETSEVNDQQAETSEVDSQQIETSEANSQQAETSETNGQQIESNSTVSYQNLETYLSDRNWEAADNETFNVLLALVGERSKAQGYFSLEEWNTFVADKEKNCPNVQKIDELWKNASDDALGFSSQMVVFRNAQPYSDIFYRMIGWVSEDRRTTLVEWIIKSEPSPADEAVVYVMNKKPNFQTPEQTRGHLPAMMAWEPEGQRQSDRRFQLFSACELGVNR
jgi:hypothetical protein